MDTSASKVLPRLLTIGVEHYILADQLLANLVQLRTGNANRLFGIEELLRLT
jgi:hypothetical protein